MQELGSYFKDTVTTATAVERRVKAAPNSNTTNYPQEHFQVAAEGSGTLTVAVRLYGMANYIDVLSLSDEVKILDMVAVQDIRLTAATADVEVSVAPYE